MSDAIVVEITKGVEALIAAGVTAAAFSQEFTAERSYADWDLGLKESAPPDVAGPIKLDIVGHTTQQAVDQTTRGLLQFTVVVDIAIRKKFGTEATAQWTGQADNESVDPLMLLTEDVFTYLAANDFADITGAAYQDTTIVVCPNRDHLRRLRQFTSIIRLTFLAHKALA